MSVFNSLSSGILDRFWKPGSSASNAVANQAANRNITNSQVKQSSQNQLNMPSGAIMAFAGTYAPDGFLLCDGRTYSAIEYPNLFDVLQYNFGGSGNSFNVPDLRGRVIVAPDKNQRNQAANRITIDDNWFGADGGDEEHTLTTDEMPSHRHAVSANQATNTTATGGQNRLTTLQDGTNGNDDAWTSYQGGGDAHNNLQPYLVLNYIIRY